MVKLGHKLEYFFGQVKFYIRKPFKLSHISFLFLPEIITGGAVDIKQYPRKVHLFKILLMFIIECFAAAPHIIFYPSILKIQKSFVKLFIVYYGHMLYAVFL